MNKEEILKKIASIHKELAQDQFEIMTKKILERKFHLHRSNRNFIIKKILEKLRKRLIMEIELIIEPILENQKDINLRFLHEINWLKKECSSFKTNCLDRKDEKKDQKSL